MNSLRNPSFASKFADNCHIPDDHPVELFRVFVDQLQELPRAVTRLNTAQRAFEIASIGAGGLTGPFLLTFRIILDDYKDAEKNYYEICDALERLIQQIERSEGVPMQEVLDRFPEPEHLRNLRLQCEESTRQALAARMALEQYKLEHPE